MEPKADKPLSGKRLPGVEKRLSAYGTRAYGVSDPEEVLRLLWDTMSSPEIGKLIGVPGRTVRFLKMNYGIPNHPKGTRFRVWLKFYGFATFADFFAHHAGKTREEIASEYGVTPHFINDAKVLLVKHLEKGKTI